MIMTQTLGKIVKEHGGLIQTGPFGSQLHQYDYTENGTPVVMPKDISGGRVSLETIVYVPDRKAQELGRHILPAHALVLPRRGDISKRAYISEEQEGILCGTGCIQVRVPEAILNPRYLYYYLEQHAMTDWLERNAIGTTMLNLSAKIVGEMPIALESMTTQERVVDILSTYDDLIENNRRRIQLLEQSAHLLYKEWFVYLRFPGHEHVGIVDGVSEGWEKVSISDLCVVGRGGSPRPIKDYIGGTIPWFKIADATASESPFIFRTKERIIEDGVRKSVLLQPEELILSNSATCGVPNFTGIDGCIHDGWLHFKNLQRVSKQFLYCCLAAKQKEILMGIGDGATQKNLNTKYIGKQTLILPKEQTLLQMFDDFAIPIFSQIFNLAQHNIQLTQARDLLLPRLMNGEITL